MQNQQFVIYLFFFIKELLKVVNLYGLVECS